MGRYSDSEEDRKKHKKKKKRKSRSRSTGSSDSRYSKKTKKSKKSSKHKYKSRSRSVERFSHRSRSTSRNRGRKSRSISRDRFSNQRRSRSRSRGRRPRSRSRSRDRYTSRTRRSRSRDWSHDRERSSRYSSRSPSRSMGGDSRGIKEDPCSNIPGFFEMTPSEQARVRMQMALKAAAAADEKIREQLQMEKSGSASPVTAEEQVKFAKAVAHIEKSGFSSSKFKSNRGDKKEPEKAKADSPGFGTIAELRLDMGAGVVKPLMDFDVNNLADKSLYVDPNEKMKRWIQKLTAMRKKKLEGEALL